MGDKVFDQYFLLHFATAVIAYFWGVSLLDWMLIHTIFEVVENTEAGSKFIRDCVPIWPGGKRRPDVIMNTIMDTVSAMLGWLFAKWFDNIGVKYGWYYPHWDIKR